MRDFFFSNKYCNVFDLQLRVRGCAGADRMPFCIGNSSINGFGYYGGVPESMPR